MYTAHFGLDAKPFKLQSPPLAFYSNAAFEAVNRALIRSLRENSGIVVLTGAAGTGKTTLLKRFVAELSGQRRTLLFTNTTLPYEDLLNYVGKELGADAADSTDPQTLSAAIRAAAAAEGEEHPPVLIIDDAHNLGSDSLAELIHLTNLRAAAGLRIVVAGLPTLADQLRTVGIDTLPVALHRHLEPLSDNEIAGFIEHQLMAAGRPENDIITPEAVMRIRSYSKGILRNVTALCDAALVEASLGELDQVDTDQVDQAAHQCLLEQIDTPEPPPTPLAEVTLADVARVVNRRSTPPQPLPRSAAPLVTGDRQPSLATGFESAPEEPPAPYRPTPSPPVPAATGFESAPEEPPASRRPTQPSTVTMDDDEELPPPDIPAFRTPPRQRRRRWPWLLALLLLMGAGAGAAAVVYLYPERVGLDRATVDYYIGRARLRGDRLWQQSQQWLEQLEAAVGDLGGDDAPDAPAPLREPTPPPAADQLSSPPAAPLQDDSSTTLPSSPPAEDTAPTSTVDDPPPSQETPYGLPITALTADARSDAESEPTSTATDSASPATGESELPSAWDPVAPTGTAADGGMDDMLDTVAEAGVAAEEDETGTDTTAAGSPEPASVTDPTPLADDDTVAGEPDTTTGDDPDAASATELDLADGDDAEPESSAETAAEPTPESITFESQPDPVAVTAANTPPALASDQQQRITSLLRDATRQRQQQRLTTPADDNALASYQAVLALDPDNQAATEGLVALKDQYQRWAEQSLARGDRASARQYYQRALRVDPENEAIQAALATLEDD